MLEHVAIWTRNLEEMKTFYCNFFDGQAGEKYQSNSEFKAPFESYFLSFGDGSRLELMKMSTIPDGISVNGHETIGITHIAFSVEKREEVDVLAQRAHGAGHPVILEPHETGDGFYELCMLDPDGNRVEIAVLP